MLAARTSDDQRHECARIAYDNIKQVVLDCDQNFAHLSVFYDFIPWDCNMPRVASTPRVLEFSQLCQIEAILGKTCEEHPIYPDNAQSFETEKIKTETMWDFDSSIDSRGAHHLHSVRRLQLLPLRSLQLASNAYNRIMSPYMHLLDEIFPLFKHANSIKLTTPGGWSLDMRCSYQAYLLLFGAVGNPLTNASIYYIIRKLAHRWYYAFTKAIDCIYYSTMCKLQSDGCGPQEDASNANRRGYVHLLKSQMTKDALQMLYGDNYKQIFNQILVHDSCFPNAYVDMEEYQLLMGSMFELRLCLCMLCSLHVSLVTACPRHSLKQKRDMSGVQGAQGAQRSTLSLYDLPDDILSNILKHSLGRTSLNILNDMAHVCNTRQRLFFTNRAREMYHKRMIWLTSLRRCCKPLAANTFWNISMRAWDEPDIFSWSLLDNKYVHLWVNDSWASSNNTSRARVVKDILKEHEELFANHTKRISPISILVQHLVRYDSCIQVSLRHLNKFNGGIKNIVDKKLIFGSNPRFFFEVPFVAHLVHKELGLLWHSVPADQVTCTCGVECAFDSSAQSSATDMSHIIKNAKAWHAIVNGSIVYSFRLSKTTATRLLSELKRDSTVNRNDSTSFYLRIYVDSCTSPEYTVFDGKRCYGPWFRVGLANETT